MASLPKRCACVVLTSQQQLGVLPPNRDTGSRCGGHGQRRALPDASVRGELLPVGILRLCRFFGIAEVVACICNNVFWSLRPRRNIYLQCWKEIEATFPEACTGPPPPVPLPPPFPPTDVCARSLAGLGSCQLYPAVKDCRDAGTFPCVQKLAVRCGRSPGSALCASFPTAIMIDALRRCVFSVVSRILARDRRRVRRRG